MSKTVIFAAIVSYILGVIIGMLAVMGADSSRKTDSSIDYICNNCEHYDGKTCGINHEFRRPTHNGCEMFKYNRCDSECSNCILCGYSPSVKSMNAQKFSCELHK